jgi:nucleotide-binding universal stress UspA family protein
VNGKKSKQILIAVDTSEYSNKAFKYACNLARDSESELQILHVIENFVDVGYSISKELENTGRRTLHKYDARARSVGLLSVNTILAKGNPAEEILKVADKKNINIIVVGSRGHYASLSDYLLGSTSYKLAHYSKCTVVIVK